MGEPAPGDVPGTAFLAPPHPTLYPCLLDGDRMRPEARDALIGYIVPILESVESGVRAWVRFATIGSGVSYNWDERGDLDVQVWIDTAGYVAAGGEDPEGLIVRLRTAIIEANYPTCADLGLATPDSVGALKVQYFAKAGTGTREDNLSEQPYGCWDIDGDEWVVRPEPITARFYGEAFLAAHADAVAISERAAGPLATLERAVRDARYWDALSRATGEPSFAERAGRSREEAAAARDTVWHLFDAVVVSRDAAYSPEGRGIHDPRDSTVKLLEVWGVFGALKSGARDPFPWEDPPG